MRSVPWYSSELVSGYAKLASHVIDVCVKKVVVLIKNPRNIFQQNLQKQPLFCQKKFKGTSTTTARTAIATQAPQQKQHKQVSGKPSSNSRIRIQKMKNFRFQPNFQETFLGTQTRLFGPRNEVHMVRFPYFLHFRYFSVNMKENMKVWLSNCYFFCMKREKVVCGGFGQFWLPLLALRSRLELLTWHFPICRYLLSVLFHVQWK